MGISVWETIDLLIVTDSDYDYPHAGYWKTFSLTASLTHSDRSGERLQDHCDSALTVQ